MSRWTPSIVPNGTDQTCYLVIDSFKRGEHLFRETGLDHADLETVIQDLLGGEYNDPVRIVCFNTEEHWSQDISEDIAHEIQKRCDLQFSEVPPHLADFIQKFVGRHHPDKQLKLRLV